MVLACTRCEAKCAWTHAMLCQIGGASLVKGRMYEFSCRMGAENLKSSSVGVALSKTNGWLPSGLYQDVSVGKAWKAYTFTFQAARDVGPTGRLQIWFTEPGMLWVADVRLSGLLAAADAGGLVAVDRSFLLARRVG